MFKNYLKIGWRSLKKQLFFTFLNTFGLAVGMAGALLISLYVYDEFSYDTAFADAERIHRINVDVKFGGTESEMAVVSAPMAAAMEADIPQVELTTRFEDSGNTLIRKTGTVKNTKESHSTFVDPSFFEMLGLDLLVGDSKTALNEPNTLILTKTAAEKHFGINKAVGQTLILNNTDTYTVTGVINDMPNNSFLRDYSVFMAMAGYEDASSTEWTSHNYYTLAKLIPSANISDFQESLQSMFGTYVIPYAQNFFPGITEEQFKAAGNHLNFSSIPLTDIHLYSDVENEMSANSSIRNVYILSSIGLFLLILASVNFMNLSTAHSLKRGKEVGIRKTLGSTKNSLLQQFLIESGLITFISLILAIIIALLLLPLFNTLSGKYIALPFANPLFWIILVLTTMVLGLLAGWYPAFFMTRFVPVEVLKGSGDKNVGGGKIRNALVVFQFAISVFLIVSTLIVYQQLNFIQSKDLGFSKNQVFIIEDAYAVGDNIASFKERVGQLAQVQNVSLTGFLTDSFLPKQHQFCQGRSYESRKCNQYANMAGRS